MVINFCCFEDCSRLVYYIRNLCVVEFLFILDWLGIIKWGKKRVEWFRI